MNKRPKWLTRHLFDIRIDAVTYADVIARVDHAIETRERLLISVVNASKLVHMERDTGLRRAVLGGDLILADGMSVVWACRMLGARLPGRVTGIDLMTGILQYCHENKKRVYCLGATEEVLAQVQERIAVDFPDAVLVGARDGYFTDEEEEDIAREIAAAQPDVLFAAMSSPKKEKFLARWSPRLDVPVCHGVGGAFDVMAGKVRRAPRAWQRLGLEWAYRVCQEPRRLVKRYAETNAIFLGMIVKEAVRSLARTLPSQAMPWRRFKAQQI